jgi:uncharacterized MAPEG superfamily protein
MVWIDLVAVLALLQMIFFAVLVALARTRYQVHAPATTGHPQFERLYRVQMNTLEMIVVLLPGLYLASHYWSPLPVAWGGALYLVGRMVYWKSYARDPATRSLGYGLSVFPVLAMLGATLLGIVLKVVA